MKKILISVLLLSVMFISLVSAGIVTNVPDDVKSFEEYKQRVLEANSETGFLAIATSNYWGLCDQTCVNLIFHGDCNPCTDGGVASLRSWHPDSMSYLDSWSSANSYCNDWLKPYDYYNQQAFCTVPSTGCSGGGDPGDEKCQSGDVWECSSSGVWEFSNDCDFGCDDGRCQQEQCSDHDDKRCSGDTVYWYDSCGDRQEEYERCESDEVCEVDRCEKDCQDGFIGEKLCSGNQVVQQYQTSDCTTEVRTVEDCNWGCENSVCVSPECSTCPDPTAWSQCDGSTMFRSNYECDATTDYSCATFIEEEACECGTSEQCDYDETCETSICEVLDCDENEIADNHKCVAIPEISMAMVILIGVGVVAFFFVIIIVVLIIKLKGGRNKK